MAASLGKLCLRKISTSVLLKDTLAEPLKEAAGSHGHGHGSGYLMWKRLFYVVCCPVMVLAYVNTKLEEEKPPPEFKKYPHLRIRKKPYPWADGQKTLFHNPHTNPLPDGYEHQLKK